MFITSVKHLYVTFILLLGLVRLTFGFGDMGFLPWLALVVAHIVEGALWWVLALRPAFNTNNLSAIDLAKEALSLKLSGGFETALQLCGVPLLVIIFLVLGPQKKTPRAIDINKRN